MAKLKRILCKNCKKPIYRSTGRLNENLKFGWNFYCSRRCEYKYKTKRQKLVCENCGKVFERAPNEISPHNYCSHSCAMIINNKRYTRRHLKPILKTCVKCKKQFKKRIGNKKYCSMKCRVEAERRYTPEQLIDIIKRTTQELKRVPAKRELKDVANICAKSFGSWNNTIVAAGLQPNRSHSQRMYKRVNAVALDGHLCDSVSEALIDNWLTKNDIFHEKNVSYPETNHKADWVIRLGKDDIFIEYFGLANDSPRYDRAIRKKKNLCRKYQLKLIEIYPQDLYPKMSLDAKLGNKLSGCPALHRN